MGQVNLNAGLMGYSSDGYSSPAHYNIKKECFECGNRDTRLTREGLRCDKCGSLFVA